MTRNLLSTRSVVTALLLLFALVACGRPDSASESQEAEEERPSRVETRWTDTHEWFVEHPLFVVGEEAEIAAHLTELGDFRAVEAGRLDVSLLDSSGAARQQVGVDSVARSGIFLPAIRPETAGNARLRFVYTSPTGAIDEVAWDVRVASSVGELDAPPSEPAGIGFLKEQQWRIPFATVAAAAAPLQESLELPATIEAHPSGTALVASPAAGFFEAPDSGLLSPGAAVRRGQLLGRLTPLPESIAGWHTLPAELVEAHNRVAESEREHARASRLVDAGAVPARRLHEAEIALENARAGLAALQNRASAVSAAGSVEDGLGILAPMGGIMAEVHVTRGEPVDPARTLFRIVDLDLLVARVEVPEPEFQELLKARRSGEVLSLALRPATAVRSTAGQNEWIVGGRLLELGVELDATTRTAPVRYELRGASATLRPGMSAVARLHVGGARTVVAIPSAAIIDLAGVQVVYLQLGGETFEERAIATGIRQGDLVEVVSGLSPGDRVVTTGAYQVRLAALSPDAAPAHSH